MDGSTTALTPGTKLRGGDYRVVRTIGRGGFSIVYEATTRRGDTVAIKELFPPDARRRSFFGLWQRNTVKHTRDWVDLTASIRAEFQLVKTLRHPNIVRVIELFSENGTLYLVMEYLPGTTLHQHLSEHRRGDKAGLSEADATIVASAMADALSYAHAKGVIHRDVKPNNILVGSDGRIVLLDFGIARKYRRGEARTRAGTEHYMAPEQLDGIGQTKLVDVYGLAATIHYLLTGAAPPSVEARRRGERLVPVDEVAPHLSAAAAAAVLHGLALDSEARTPSTTAFAEEFRGTPIALARFDARTEARRSLSRSLIIVALAVALAAAGWLLFPR